MFPLSQMITDTRVLQPKFVPGEVQHCYAEVNHLSAALLPHRR